MAEQNSFNEELRLIVIATIVVTISFLWKDLFSDIIEKYHPKNLGLIGQFMITIIITIILVYVIMYLKNGNNGNNLDPAGDGIDIMPDDIN